MRRAGLSIASCGTLVLLAAQAAQAQFAVIDAASVTQLIQQAQTLAQQLQTVRAQLTQERSLYQSMTGSRGMQRLLGGAGASSLPADWAELSAALHGTGPYAALAADVSANVASNALLPAGQLATLSAADSAQIGAARASVALLQGLAQQGLLDNGERIGELHQLIGAMGAAADQKGMLELQAAIGAERGLLENEQTKLQLLDQAARATELANRQREREQIIADQGRFASRFEPSPP